MYEVGRKHTGGKLESKEQGKGEGKAESTGQREEEEDKCNW